MHVDPGAAGEVGGAVVDDPRPLAVDRVGVREPCVNAPGGPRAAQLGPRSSMTSMISMPPPFGSWHRPVASVVSVSRRTLALARTWMSCWRPVTLVLAGAQCAEPWSASHFGATWPSAGQPDQPLTDAADLVLAQGAEGAVRSLLPAGWKNSRSVPPPVSAVPRPRGSSRGAPRSRRPGGCPGRLRLGRRERSSRVRVVGQRGRRKRERRSWLQQPIPPNLRMNPQPIYPTPFFPGREVPKRPLLDAYDPGGGAPARPFRWRAVRAPPDEAVRAARVARGAGLRGGHARAPRRARGSGGATGIVRSPRARGALVGGLALGFPDRDAQSVAVALLLLTIAAGRLGEDHELENLAPAFVVGATSPVLVVVSILLGPVWRWIDPWDAIARALARDDDSKAPGHVWPAALVAVAGVWYLSAYSHTLSPRSVGTALAAYSLLTVGGCLALGRVRWLASSEPLGIVLSWMALVPRRGLVDSAPPRGANALLGVLAGGLLFGAARHSELWGGLNTSAHAELVATAGLIAACAVVVGCCAHVGATAGGTRAQLSPARWCRCCRRDRCGGHGAQPPDHQRQLLPGLSTTPSVGLGYLLGAPEPGARRHAARHHRPLGGPADRAPGRVRRGRHRARAAHSPARPETGCRGPSRCRGSSSVSLVTHDSPCRRRYHCSTDVELSAMRALSHPRSDELGMPSVLHALSDPVRLEIVRTLHVQAELCCSQLPAPVSKSTLSHHLKVLREAGVTYTRAEGTQRFVSLRSDDLNSCFPGLLGCVLEGSHGPPRACARIPRAL